MENCVFCKIVSGIIPSRKLYEDGQVLAFLDINPIAEGHTLVIPKKHATNMFDIAEEEAAQLMRGIKNVARLLEKAYGSNLTITNANGRLASQLVGHLHFHLIPRRENDLFAKADEVTAIDRRLKLDSAQFDAVLRKILEKK